MQETLFSQGIDLMLFGMGTVAVFLAVLVVVTTCMSKLVVRYFPEPDEPEIGAVHAVARPSTANVVDDSTLQIIQAAIEQHRAKR